MGYLRVYGWFILLCLILGVISIASLKPEFYLMGFDNYSSYLNPKETIFRTIFSAWRNHWGLGVPADSEIVDLPRQLIYLFLSIIFPKQLLDQLYIVGTLIFGAIGMFLLGKLLYSKFIFPHSKKHWDNMFGFIAAFFYIFNLNTLGMYYFIIITYNSRFSAIPWLFYIFFYILFHKHISLKRYLLFALVIFIASGSYITGTILLTTGITLGIASLFYFIKKKLAVTTFFLLFACINAFWLPTFLNYTVQKSSIIRLAPTFIDANEAQLNKSKSWYDFGNQVSLTPNFLELKVSNNEGTTYPWHPLTDQITQLPFNILIFLFPFLYIIGSIYMLVRWKKYMYLLWVPSIIFLFIFLSLKEYSPLGFIYSFLDQKIPLFGVLFRFGDTKFHPYVAFAGSIAAAIFLLESVRFIKQENAQKSVLLSLITSIIVFNFFLFKYYFTGSLIGPLLYSKLPDPYFKIAQTINADSEEYRVLHLPIEKDGYWKIYSWGYTGSSFFHYLIDKPFIDRTFEPASMENSYLHKKLYDLTANMQPVIAQGDYDERLNELYNVLKTANVRYILFDETVGAEQQSRGLVYWGEYHSIDVKEGLNQLVQNGLLEEVERHTITPQEFIDDYKSLPYPPRSFTTENTLEQDIVLYKLTSPTKRISFIESAEFVDPAFDSVLNSSVVKDGSHILQNYKKEGSIYPFKNPSQDVTFEDNSTVIKSKKEFEPNKVYTVYSKKPSEPTDRIMVEANIKSTEKGIVSLSIYRIDGPQLGEISFKTLLGSMEIPTDELSGIPWKIAINGYIFDPPKEITATDSVLGRVMVDVDSLKVQLLKRDFVTNIDPGLLRFTENPNCFNDKLSGYAFSAKKEGDSVVIDAQNGSVCVWRGLVDILDKTLEKTQYFQVNIDVEGTQTDIDDQFDHTLSNLAKPQLYEYVTTQSKPNLLRICVKEVSIDECMNENDLFTIDQRQKITIPISQTIEGLYDPAIVFTVMHNTYQKQQIKIHSMAVESFSNVQEYRIDGVEAAPQTIGSFEIEGNSSTELPLIIPHAESRYSFRKAENTGFFVSNSPCEGAFRTFRKIEGTWLSYISNCDNELFKELPFNSGNFYLWGIEYNLFSGKFPKFILKDDLYEYKDEYTSLYQGYPDITGFKAFQTPEWGQTANFGPQMSNLPFVSAYTFIKPQPDIGDTKPKKFTLHQDSTNEAGFLLKSFSVTELPTAWEDLVIEPENNEVTYSMPQSYTFKKILPSLWEVNINKIGKGSMLLMFGEGYDSQWTIAGAKSHSRCDGFANCFELGDELFTEGFSKTLYIYYWPQTLSYIGWGITAFGIVGIYYFLVRKK